jgi:hypothetical protein
VADLNVPKPASGNVATQRLDRTAKLGGRFALRVQPVGGRAVRLALAPLGQQRLIDFTTPALFELRCRPVHCTDRVRSDAGVVNAYAPDIFDS